MSILSQIETNENEVIDCVERFFSKHHIGNFFRNAMERKRKAFQRFLFYDINLATSLLQGVCT